MQVILAYLYVETIQVSQSDLLIHLIHNSAMWVRQPENESDSEEEDKVDYTMSVSTSALAET